MFLYMQYNISEFGSKTYIFNTCVSLVLWTPNLQISTTTTHVNMYLFYTQHTSILLQWTAYVCKFGDFYNKVMGISFLIHEFSPCEQFSWNKLPSQFDGYLYVHIVYT
jgi:hypothetical protein